MILYDFTPVGNVGPDDFYTEERGFGFIVGQIMEKQPRLMLPELNGGFLPVPWYRLPEPEEIIQTEYGCKLLHKDPEAAVSDGETSPVSGRKRQIPLRFKCHVPAEGS